MKKCSIILSLLLLPALPVMAQIELGVRGGAIYSSMVQKVDGRAEAHSRFGYSLALISDIYIWNEFSLRPEVAFVQQGGGFQRERPIYCVTTPCPSGITSLFEYRYYSIQVPVNICYTFKFSNIDVNLFGGPFADFSLFGKEKEGEWNGDISFGTKETDGLKPFDMGLNVGLGAEYSNIFCSISAACGFLDRNISTTESPASVYQNNVTFSLGYYFHK